MRERAEWDVAVLRRAVDQGAEVRQRAPVRALDQAADHASARLAELVSRRPARMALSLLTRV